MADQFQLDLPTVLNSQFGGGSVQQINPDGSANVAIADKDGNRQVVKFDPIAYSKANGIDPTKVKVQYNSPETALNENPIGFADGLVMSLADDKANAEFLKGKYGDEGVKKNPEGGFLVNDKGAWKKADPGFLARVASMAPEMAAFGPGEIAGAALGTAVAGPLGTAVGAVAGGAIAASLASLVKNKGAESLNLRSEQDAGEAAKTFGHDLVNNLIWGSTLKVAGASAKYAGSTVAGVAGRVWGAVDKEGLAAAAEKLLPGTSATDWSAVVRSPEDAKAVQDGLKQMAAYGQQSAERIQKGIDPMTRGMTSTVKDFMDGAKTSAENMYGGMLKDFEGSGITNKPVTVAASAVRLKSAMMEMGLIDEKNGVEFFNPKPTSENPERILQVFDNKSRNTIRDVYNQITNVAKDGGDIPFGKATKLIGGVDDILENSGFYKNGPEALSNNVRRTLSEFRKNLSGNIADSLKGQSVIRDGETTNALTYYQEVNSKYSKFRSVMNDFSVSNKLGGDLRQQAVTIDKMLGEKGYGLEDSFIKLGSAVGQDAAPVLQSLQQMRAAKNLSDIYTPSKGVLSWAREAATGGPRDWANRMAQSTQTKAIYEKQWNDSLLAKIPAKDSSKALVEATAHAADFVNKLGVQDKVNLITNPQALRSMINAVVSTPQLQQTAAGSLMKSAADSINQGKGQ